MCLPHFYSIAIKTKQQSSLGNKFDGVTVNEASLSNSEVPLACEVECISLIYNVHSSNSSEKKISKRLVQQTKLASLLSISDQNSKTIKGSAGSFKLETRVRVSCDLLHIHNISSNNNSNGNVVNNCN